MASRAKRWLVGCGIGCGGLLVLAIATAIGFGIWVRGPGELLEPQKLLGADTTGYLEWTLTLDDEGTEGFARALIEVVRTLPAETADELPAWLYSWLSRQQSREAERDIMQLFPMVAAWTVRPGRTPDDDLHLLSLSIERIGNRLVLGDWIMGWALPWSDEVEIVRHGNEKIYQLPLPGDARLTLFLRGGNIFLTSDADTARLAVDRLGAPAAAASHGERADVEGLFAATAGRGALRGAIDNRRGELFRLWRTISARSSTPVERELWTGFRGLSLSGGLTADGSLATLLSFHCPDEDWADEHALGLIMALHDGLEWMDLDVQIQARPVGERIDVELSVPDLTGRVGDWIRHARQIETESGRTVHVDF